MERDETQLDRIEQHLADTVKYTRATTTRTGLLLMVVLLLLAMTCATGGLIGSAFR